MGKVCERHPNYNYNAGFLDVSTLPLMVDQRVFLAELKQHLTDQYIQSWLGNLRDTSGKLHT